MTKLQLDSQKERGRITAQINKIINEIKMLYTYTFYIYIYTHIHTMEYFSALKKKKNFIFATKRMDLSYHA